MKRIFGGGGGGALWKPKNPHSLEYLKYLHSVLEKNKIVTGNNRNLVVEALRAIAEILIWGDQNDSTVFDFFLEKQMLSFFLSIMRQKCGGRVTVQLLQTLNIMFENIRHETSLYFLLSNNHVNSIISHPFDFTNEEIMAYYISFLRTLSLKLNAFTIHFFFDDKAGEFPLYTEALRFYNHSEMRDTAVIKFNVDSGIALNYFTNLVAHVKNQIVEMDTYLHSDHDSEHCMDRLNDFIDEHLDNIHYVNDILILDLDDINQLLVDQLMRRLFLPIYLGSLAPELQVFLTITYTPLVEQLLTLLLFGDANDLLLGVQALNDALDNSCAPAVSPEPDTSSDEDGSVGCSRNAPVLNGVVPLQLTASDTMTSLDEMSTVAQRPLFASLLGTLECTSAAGDHESVFAVILFLAVGRNKGVPTHLLEAAQLPASCSQCAYPARSACATPVPCSTPCASENAPTPTLATPTAAGGSLPHQQHVPLCRAGQQLPHASRQQHCDRHVVDRLVRVIVAASLEGSRTSSKLMSKLPLADSVRVITVQLCCLLLRQMILTSDGDEHDHDAAQSSSSSSSTQPAVNRSPQHTSFWGRNGRLSRSLFQAKQNLAEHLADVYRNCEGTDLVDAFEYQYERMQHYEIRPERLAENAELLISPQSPFLARSHVSPHFRCPLDENEGVQRNVHLFLLVRQFLLDLHGKCDDCLPMQGPKESVKINDCFDLSKCDILACTVIVKSRGRTRSQRYLVTDELQLILVEPDARKLGYGIAQFVAWLQPRFTQTQDVEIQGDKDDPRSLRVTIRPGPSGRAANAPPLLVAKFVFDDHIRCMAARQRLVKGRQLARQYKMDIIGDILSIPKSERRQNQNTARGGNSHSGKLPGFARPHQKGVAVTSVQYHRSGSSSARTSNASPQRPPRSSDGTKKTPDSSSGNSPRTATPNAQKLDDNSNDSIQLDDLKLDPVQDAESARRILSGKDQARFVPVSGSGKAQPIRQL